MLGYENYNIPSLIPWPNAPLFQFVMHDYGTRLFDGITKCRRVQSSAMQFLLTHRFVSILFTFIFVYFKLLFVYLHTCSKDDPSWKPPSLSTPLLAEDLDRPSYSTLPAPKALNIHAKNKKVGLYFIFLRILDVLSYTVPHSINMTWRSIIDIFFCRAANRRSWCSTRWRSASPK